MIATTLGAVGPIRLDAVTIETQIVVSGDFAGDGEVAARLRLIDWSATPLGPVDGWPQSLRTAVRIMLTSRYAMWMAWGPELTFLCNDAYLPTVGLKRDWVLGARSDKVWAEIWPDIGPRIEGVLATGQATWDESLLLFLERSGFAEETYHTFSYSPLADDDGRINGMLCVVSEVTDREISQRRIALLGDLGSRLAACRSQDHIFAAVETCIAADNRDLPFVLIYLTDEAAAKARLVARAGLEAGDPAAPETIALPDRTGPWPAGQVIASGSAQEVDVSDRPLPARPWPKPPARAIVLPLAQQGQDRALGVLVTAVNPFRPLDGAYESFIDLLVGQVAAALANVNALEQERKRAEALAELDRAKTAFFSNVSHEFRTPLTLVLGPLQEASERGEGLAADRLAVVNRNATRLSKLVNSLLDFSRIEAGRVEARFEPVDLAQLTSDLALSFQGLMDAGGLAFSVECKPLPRAAFVDIEMWEKVVLNLLSNAFKFTLDGAVAVRLGASDTGRAAVLEVVDSGVGIPEAERSRIFDRFHRVAGSKGRSFEGTGIGLALVQELIRLHGGTISVSSNTGRGSTFVVTVPLGREHLPNSQISQPVPRTETQARADAFVGEAARWLADDGTPSPRDALAEVAAAPASGLRDAVILIADDNADMRDYLVRLLRGQGYPILTAGDGETALTLIREHRPNLVLSDVMMPRLDGFGLLAAIRADQSISGIPVILLSARAGEEAIVEGVGAGADDYLTKPFAARELIAKISGALTLAAARREVAEVTIAQNRILELAASNAPASQLLDQIALFIEAREPDCRCSIQVASDDGSRFVRGRGPNMPVAFHEFMDGRPIGARGSCGEAITQSVPAIVPDLARADAFSDEWKSAILGCGFHAVRSTPIRGSSGTPLGSLAIFYDRPREPTPREPSLIDIGTHLAGLVIERDRSDRRLRRSEERLRLATNAVPALISFIDSDFCYEYANEAYRTWFGVDPLTMPGRHMRDVLGDAAFISLESRARQALSGEHVRFESVVPYSSGGFRRVSGDYVPRRTSSGAVDGFYVLIYDVTERRNLEDRAAATSRWLDIAQDQIGIGTWNHDFATGNAQWSPSLYQLLGYEPGSVPASADSFLARVHPDDRAPLMALVDAVEAGDAEFDTEFRVVHPEGLRWFTGRGHVVRDEQGQALSMLGINVDITDRKATEIAIEVRNRRLALLAKIGEDLLGSGDVTSQVQRAFDAVATEIGAEIYFSYLTDADDPGTLRLAASGGIDTRTCAQIGKLTVGQYLCGRVASERRKLILTDVQNDPQDAASFIRDRGAQSYAGYPLLAQGVLIGTIAFCSTHSTEFAPIDLEFLETVTSQFSAAILRDKLAAEERRATEALSESETRFRNMADNAPVMIWVTEADGRCTYLSQSWYEFTGQDEANGLGFGWLDAVHPADRPVAGSMYLEAVQAKAPFRLEYRLRSKAGAYRWAIDAARPRLGERGEFLGFIGSVFDISDRRDAEDRLRFSETRYREAAFEREAILSQLVEGVIVTDAAGKIIFVNDAAAELHGTRELGVEPGDYTARYQLLTEAGKPYPPDELPLARAVLNGEDIREARWRIRRPDGSEILAVGSARPVTGPDSSRLGAVLTLRDDTERERASDRQRLLTNELNHRVKNTLAIIQSIASQTARYTPEPVMFRETFTARMVALSQIHDVLTQGAWSGANLFDIVSLTLQPYGGSGDRAIVSGPKLTLSPETAVSMSMAMHELATNASKYGALSVPAGCVRVAWSVGPAADAARVLDLAWTERGGPPVSRPSRTGFGSRLLQSLARQLSAEIDQSFEETGAACRIRVVLDDQPALH